MNNIRDGKEDENSAMYKNQCYGAFGYAMMADSQQMETTKGTLFGAYNAITGYFQNVRNYKDDESKLKSILLGGIGQLRSQAAFNLCANFAGKGENALILN